MEDFLENEESLKTIFSYFPNWVSLFEINGISNQGKVNKMSDSGLQQLGKLFTMKGKTVLELAPLEAGHSILMQEFGAKSVISLEGRLENYLKCCVIKNIFNLSNVRFYLEDLRKTKLEKFGNFDVCICSGLLYHLPEPQEMINEVSKVAPRLFINTHYSNEKTTKRSEVILNGRKYEGSLYDEIDVKHPNSALQQFSFWFFKKDLIKVLNDVGYSSVKILKDTGTDQPKSPAISLYATKE